MYLLIDEDGKVTQQDQDPKVDPCCWPVVIKIELYAGPDVSAFHQTSDGWEELEDD